VNALLGVGGAYAVSAGLIIYADQNALIESDLRLPILLVWAVSGLILAALSAVRRKDA
jgi:hypothetical protein